MFLTHWLEELSKCIREGVDAAPNGVVRVDVSGLAALWACPYEQAEKLVCEAALRANLVVGIVDNCFCDVMAIEQACAVCEDLERERARTDC